MLEKLKKDLKKKIKKADKVYVVGHNFIDLDVLGASIAVFKIANKYKRECYIIINDDVLEDSVSKAIDSISSGVKFIKKEDINDFSYSLLVVVDTNKYDLICLDNLNLFFDVIVIDHHDVSKNTINIGTKYIDTTFSSASEVMTCILYRLGIKIDAVCANIILAGIVIDTNNFTLRTTANTFRCATYLLSNGADTVKVQYLLKQDIKKFIKRQKLLSNIEIINKKIAISVGKSFDIYKKDDLARTSQSLLLFEKIEASFTIGYLDKRVVGISGRSYGNINISNIMKKLGGGGNNSEGATIIYDTSITDAVNKLKGILIKK